MLQNFKDTLQRVVKSGMDARYMGPPYLHTIKLEKGFEF